MSRTRLAVRARLLRPAGRLWRLFAIAAVAVAAVAAGCGHNATESPSPPSPSNSAAARGSGTSPAARRDLEADERCGGHTLARHVGRTDAQLAERLRDQRDIAAASTYTDRATAETTVAAALAGEAERVRRWTARHGRRPNIVLRYRASSGQSFGRSLRRGAPAAVPANAALIVLRWREDRDDFCVLTSYPEVRR